MCNTSTHHINRKIENVAANKNEQPVAWATTKLEPIWNMVRKYQIEEADRDATATQIIRM